MTFSFRALISAILVTFILGARPGSGEETRFGPTRIHLTRENNYMASVPPFSWKRPGRIRIDITWSIVSTDSINILHRATLLNPKGKEVARVERLLKSSPATSTIVYNIKPGDIDQTSPARTHWLLTVFNVDPSLNKRTASATIDVHCAFLPTTPAAPDRR